MPAMDSPSLRHFLKAYRGDLEATLSLLLSILAFAFWIVDPTSVIPRPVLLIVAVLGFVTASYVVWRKEAMRVYELTNPKIEIIFENGIGPYLEEVNRGEGKFSWLFRVGVRNTTHRTIEDVILALVHTEPQICSYLPVPMRAMHFELGPLHPFKDRLFDIVYKLSEVETIQVCHTVDHAPLNIRSGEYVFSLAASGQDVHAERQFRVWVNGERLMVAPMQSP